MGILEVRTDSPLFLLTDKAAIRLYFFLLSQAVDYFQNGDAYVGTWETSGHESAADVLVQEGFMLPIEDGDVPEDYYLLTNKKKLLVNVISPYAEAMGKVQQLEVLIRPSLKDRSYRYKADLSKWLELLPALEKPQGKFLTSKDLMWVWECMYGLTWQQPARQFTGKEVGQFGHLIRYYEMAHCVRMIIHYLTVAKVPSIGHLLTKKDEYFHTVIGKLNTDNTIETNDGGF